MDSNNPNDPNDPNDIDLAVGDGPALPPSSSPLSVSPVRWKGLSGGVGLTHGAEVVVSSLIWSIGRLIVCNRDDAGKGDAVGKGNTAGSRDAEGKADYEGTSVPPVSVVITFSLQGISRWP